MTGGRRTIPELMDDPTVPRGSIDRALHELAIINRWLGGERVSRLGVGRIVRSLRPGTPITILDVGAGGFDLSRALAPLGRQFEVTALDIKPTTVDGPHVRWGHPNGLRGEIRVGK